MRLLLSAYTMGAARGSEPGVGWNVARGLSLRGHEVTVVCNKKYSEENYKAIHEENLRINLIEDDCGLEEYDGIKSYRIWQKRVPLLLKKIAADTHAQIVHHVTFNQYRGLCDVFGVGLPYLIGPIGGAEMISPAFMAHGGVSFVAFPDHDEESSAWYPS